MATRHINVSPFPIITFSLLLTLILIPQGAAHSQSLQVDSLIASQMEFRHIPGLSLAVIRDGVPVKIKGYGLSNLEHGVPVHPETIFESGSVGKQFTSTLIMMLVEEGKIGLDESIRKYFPEAPDFWQEIRIRNLLTHTSGIPDYEGNAASGINYQQNYTEAELLKKAMAMPLDFQPGEKWSYSNTAYVVLGILIHKISGMFYGDMSRERVFTPLSMETARVISEEDIIPNRAAGYRLVRGEWKNQEWVAPQLNTTADGSLYFTILDLVKWDAALSARKLLSEESYKQIWSPVRLNSDSLHPYGFGWFLSPLNGHRKVSHSGSWQGFNSYIARYPDDGLTVILLANLSPAWLGRVEQAVAGLYVPALAPEVSSVIPDKDPTFTKTARRLFAVPDTTNVDTGLFAKEYLVNAKRFLALNRRYIDRFGPVRSIDMVGYEAEEEGTMCRYRIRYTVGGRITTIVRNQSGSISSVSSRGE